MFTQGDIFSFNFNTRGSKMKKLYIANAFSLNMLPDNAVNNLAIVNISKSDVDSLIRVPGQQIINAIGHPTTDVIIRNMLTGLPIGERLNVKINSGDSLIVAQYSGPRLPEGAVALPEGAGFKWYLIGLNE
jgi:hypothetical protein